MHRRPKWLIPVAAVVAIGMVVVPLVTSYHSIVEKERHVDRAFEDLNLQLQRRVDLIPSAVQTAHAALEQEQGIFGQLALARANYAAAENHDQQLEAGRQVEHALERLLVIVESDPTLQGNQNLRSVQDHLEGTGSRVAQGRRDYNDATTDYNRTVRRFPRSLVATLFGFDERTLFEVQEPG